MEKRYKFMDILRITAAFLVMWGHYISDGTFAESIPGVVSDNNQLPILDWNKHSLWKIESWLIDNVHTQTAIVGVLLFFIITGYLIALMLERYTPAQFLVNRLFRIFPTLIVCILINSAFVYFTQGITFKPINFFASMTLTYSILLVPPIMGILWTLVVEVVFYLLAAIIRKFDIYRLIYLYAAIFAIIIVSAQFKNSYTLTLAYNFKFVSYILIGSAIYLSENLKNLYNKIMLILSAAVFTFITFKLYSIQFNDTTTYPNIGTHFVVLFIFISLYMIEIKFPVLLEFIAHSLSFLSEMVYPIYLLHVSIGLGFMYILALKGFDQYLIIAGGVIASIIISKIVNIVIEKPAINLGKNINKKIKVYQNSNLIKRDADTISDNI